MSVEVYKGTFQKHREWPSDVLAAQVDFDMVEFQRDIGRMLCRIVNGIYHSMPIRDNSNNAIHDDPPACLPQEFVRLRNQDFTYLLNDQMTRLSVTKSQQDIAYLSQMEHYSLEGIMQCKEHERLKAVVFGRNLNN